MADKWQPLKYVAILPTAVIKSLDKAVSTLSTTLTAITKILKLLQFFISSFNSFSTILQTFVNFAQQQLAQFSGDILNAGVYYNILVPPAFLKSFSDPKNSTGGYNGFLNRLKVSLNNPADRNAPKFSDNASMGGFIILCDTETLIDFFKGLDFLSGLFDFFNLFPINNAPLPPRNVKAVSGYFVRDGFKEKQIGVKISWDAPRVAGFTNYRLSRSQVRNGVYTQTNPIPTKLIGSKGHENEGLLKAAQYRFASGANTWPPVDGYAYLDPTFNKGVPVITGVNVANGSGAYIDFDVDKNSVNQDKQYFYVVESGFSLGNLWGPRSFETQVSVNLKGCINENQQAVVQHKNGSLEFLSAGVDSLGQWGSVKTNVVIPFLDTVVDTLNKFVSGLAGSLKTNSKSFSDFLTGIANKVKKYQDTLKTLVEIVTAIENFFSGAPKIAFLNLPPAQGGTSNFMQRIKKATQPTGGFSGINGYTVGIVFAYGEANFYPSAMNAEQAALLQTELKMQSDALGKAFGILVKALS